MFQGTGVQGVNLKQSSTSPASPVLNLSTRWNPNFVYSKYVEQQHGKKQYNKDRMFITKTDWATEWGSAKSSAIKELNIKTKNWELLTDETFTREDLITIQNPNALDRRVGSRGF
ncbi:unnamed protein product [Camellia sinensis]